MISCTIKSLPAHQAVAAAQRAVRINPANQPAVELLASSLEAEAFRPQHLALLTSKYWGAGGVKLSVKFLDVTDPALQVRILSHMNAWNARANVVFSQSDSSSADVRLSTTPGSGYWSYLGVDIHGIAPGQPTMNLDSFSMSTPESEYRRVVRHETGHTLGFPHEHLRKAIVTLLDPEKTIAYFSSTQGWTREDVIAQVLSPLAESDLTANATDVHSIMCYQLDASITRSGQPIPGGDDIDESDYQLAEKLYPKSAGPTPPPGPPTPPASGKPLFSLSFGRAVAKGGQVTFRSPVVIPVGQYGFVPAPGHEPVIEAQVASE